MALPQEAWLLIALGLEPRYVDPCGNVRSPRAHGEHWARPGRLLKYSEMTYKVSLEAEPVSSQRVTLSLDKNRAPSQAGWGHTSSPGSQNAPGLC